ncbi:N-acetyl-gamma-glutamyl-phosphate reductase [Dissulfurirhabdus thermomarina]|uniref:N-acetyl-gamma-glutamyl-phosphate reductase n=1 Tax=Dissulfurirhabdus thermomarina TaxID=1765737 RepID=A0A6N9TPJ2_DISTH|nr:N-acetyl-gamma-glutamyl-phosphate reductase [Dissulfurirhabdus thermomarina]NDY42013.1 N-acetyl-gamma-glutamyl-phosphate reductase [Dissulfurirhabdus thermomarina]NMX24002.1 N-acetyl-gamma-glutamyl-phosphate reductase [Dissulfurirhabdus thermomarina]
MLKVAIVGGSGYTGLELLRLLARHPEVRVTAITSRRYEGREVTEVFPSLQPYRGLAFTAPEPAALAGQAEFFFTAVPHQAAMKVVPGLLAAGGRVVDLSADFRLRDRQTYEAWYQAHEAPELLDEAVYGLPEVYGPRIAAARLVANPGCYPTSALLPLVPLLREGLVAPEGLVIDSKSGASGAGRGASLATAFCEVNEAFRAYKVGEHRHTPEIEQELSAAAGRPVVVNFTPHLVPVSRGIFTTIYADLARPGTGTAEILACLEAFHRPHPFVTVLPEGTLPNVLHVRGGNACHIGARVDPRTGRVILLSVIDNLVKGAAGQAIQNLNLMAGLDPASGLDITGLCP